MAAVKMEKETYTQRTVSYKEQNEYENTRPKVLFSLLWTVLFSVAARNDQVWSQAFHA